ncbi:hypothetical protein CEN50_02275 [Fischerella thermalis CCMEE 5268]|uniref:Uncharacterized protein n=1 Tax=Fischerella thermalis CCMEE 5268 TaxID=2019662 RepID=A0A2N6KLK4_9CYAN|nr:hypothetical protein [Fischerella thermalis]PMB00722.1 hypothetical protein CEN50_02275 [Fischerella thermalis CCMEE 5268]PMB50025.1 hypothetical protein CEN40_03140 [Fischerella thermalis CCMEE 5205]
MEPLQKQMLSLSSKLDSLYQVIEQLDNKVSQALSLCRLDVKDEDRENVLENSDSSRFHFKGHISFNPEMEHKDVIADEIYSDSNLQGGEKHIAPEIQIQRLTAQLTAAYNRIAALEEQLLLKRIH